MVLASGSEPGVKETACRLHASHTDHCVLRAAPFLL
jgi:hypothetical protein